MESGDFHSAPVMLQEPRDPWLSYALDVVDAMGAVDAMDAMDALSLQPLRPPCCPAGRTQNGLAAQYIFHPGCTSSSRTPRFHVQQNLMIMLKLPKL